MITLVTKGITNSYTYKHINNTRVSTSLVEPFTKIMITYYAQNFAWLSLIEYTVSVLYKV